MRQLKRISFFIYSCLLLGTGFYGHIKYMEFFYPGNGAASVREAPKEAEHAAAASALPDRITRDTVFVIQSCDLVTGETAQREERAAERYVGMEREEFVRCMQNEGEAPQLEERQKGLGSVEVLSFSAERIVIKKTYHRSEKQAEAFWLFFRDNLVVVYEEDKSTVYMRTVVDGRGLPTALRDEISYGKMVASRLELEQFLDSYSKYRAE